MSEKASTKVTKVEEQNKALAKQYFKAWNEGDFEAMGEILATDYKFEMLNIPPPK